MGKISACLGFAWSAPKWVKAAIVIIHLVCKRSLKWSSNQQPVFLFTKLLQIGHRHVFEVSKPDILASIATYYLTGISYDNTDTWFRQSGDTHSTCRCEYAPNYLGAGACLPVCSNVLFVISIVVKQVMQWQWNLGSGNRFWYDTGTISVFHSAKIT